jgi:hypothetical protein
MTVDGSAADTGVEAAITAAVRDYYEGWFEADASRMRRALHPSLVKRSVHGTPGDMAEVTYDDMVGATEQGEGARHGPDRRSFAISINHVHNTIADVHVIGDVYVDYLQMAEIDGRWQIINALWAPATEGG